MGARAERRATKGAMNRPDPGKLKAYQGGHGTTDKPANIPVNMGAPGETKFQVALEPKQDDASSALTGPPGKPVRYPRKLDDMSCQAARSRQAWEKSEDESNTNMGE